MLSYLKNVFYSVPTLLLSAMIIPNILEYIKILLKLSPLLWIYK